MIVIVRARGHSCQRRRTDIRLWSMPIEPKLLKGFRDVLPDQASARRSVQSAIESVFVRFGYVPIDTPVLEYAEILLSKGGGETDRQVYRFKDQGGRDIALRFDLTVPFARYMAQHRSELYLPFRRYHMAKVFRGEKPQRGRYREFMQCDIDMVGSDGASSDAEIVIVMAEALRAAGAPGVRMHLSHRALTNRMLGHIALEPDAAAAVLREIDKRRKVGPERSAAALTALVGDERAARIAAFLDCCGAADAVAAAAALAGGPGRDSDRLQQVFAVLEATGYADWVRFDPTITRGLDYYTGMVFETFIQDLESIGSVCSGGRYDNLVATFTQQSMSGIGASIGFDRLLAALNELDAAPGDRSVGDVLVLHTDPELVPEYHRLAAEVRRAGFRAEVYPDAKKLATQFGYAERKGLPLTVAVGRSTETVLVRTIADRNQVEVERTAVTSAIRAALGRT